MTILHGLGNRPGVLDSLEHLAGVAAATAAPRRAARLWGAVDALRQEIGNARSVHESVPYERWRYHTFVELIRGVRGWQLAHGPGDSSTFRGLHAEVRSLQDFIYSREKQPEPATPNVHRRQQPGDQPRAAGRSKDTGQPGP